MKTRPFWLAVRSGLKWELVEIPDEHKKLPLMQLVLMEHRRSPEHRFIVLPTGKVKAIADQMEDILPEDPKVDWVVIVQRFFDRLVNEAMRGETIMKPRAVLVTYENHTIVVQKTETGRIDGLMMEKIRMAVELHACNRLPDPEAQS